MSENKISEIIRTSLEKIKSLADAETVIGNPIETPNGTTVIPVSKVSVGFASGGVDYNDKKAPGAAQNFGGGGGTGMTVTPISFLIISPDGNVQLLPITNPAQPDAVDKVTAFIERSPDLFERVKAIFKSEKAKKEESPAKEAIIEVYHDVLEPNLATDALQRELDELETEINVTAGLVEDCIKENAHVALDQAEYQKRYDALVARFDTAKARQSELAKKITDRKARRQRIEMFLTDLKKRESLTIFRDEDWLAMVDHMTITEDSSIMVTFKDGTEIEV
jgi:sporulation protein YtfJ